MEHKMLILSHDLKPNKLELKNFQKTGKKVCFFPELPKRK